MTAQGPASADPRAALDRLMQQGRFADVIGLYGALPAKERRRPALVNTYACALILTRNPGKAARVLRDIPAGQRSADNWINLCAVTIQLGNPDEALGLLERALTRFPGNQALLLTKSRCLADLGRDADAYEAALAALAAGEDDASLFAAGRAADRLRRPDEAIDYYRGALALNPGHGAAANNLNMLYMQTRRFAEAWDLAETAMHSPANRAHYRRYFSAGCQPWEGGPLDGRRLHVIGDQGVGDQIMMSQFLKNLGRFRPERVCVYLDPRLNGLFERWFRTDMDIGFLAWPREPAFDRHDRKLALSSLPNHTMREAGDFPRKPFLTGIPVREPLSGPAGRAVFGLSWWSSGLAGAERSLDLEELAAALLDQEADFLSLQYAPEAAGAARLKGLMGDRLIVREDLDCTNDFIGMAETVRRLRGVVSVPNTTVHIAGAVGAATGVLLPAEPSWRYVSNDDRMIWYGDHIALLKQREGVDLKTRIGTFIGNFAP